MAGFLNNLMNAIASGYNAEDPLFGGLIPRRRDDREEDYIRNKDYGPPTMPSRGSNPPIRQTGMDRVNDVMINNPNPQQGPSRGGYGRTANIGDKEIRFDYTNQQLGLEREKLGLARDKFYSDKGINEGELNLKNREQLRKETDDKNTLDINRDKQEIDHRKQALDEWKARNPEGEVKVVDGKVFIVDKRSGQSINTGLAGEHFSEEEVTG